MSHFSRRSLLKGALAAAGAAAGARIGGPFVRTAHAAGETSHFVHIYFNGGLNALFSGNADKFVGKAFGVKAPGTKLAGTDTIDPTSAVEIGNGVFTDFGTFGQLTDIAKQHWGAFGIKHGQALHTTNTNLRSGGERALLINGDHSYLNELASHMGGESAFKAVYFGDRGVAYQNQPAFNKVPLERVSDIKDALNAAGAGEVDPDAPKRAEGASTLETAQALSQRQIETNPGRLGSLDDAYKGGIDSLRKAPPKPVTFDELNTVYGLGGKSVINASTVWGAQMAGAEAMIRGAGSNVIHCCDYNLASWDFHQVGSGGSLNGTFSRNKLKGGVGGFGSSRINPIKTFIDRMLKLEDRNVVICVSGELVRLPSGDHGDGTVAMMFGKYIKQGVSFGVTSEGSRFAPGTPNVKGFWAAVAAACKVPGNPFGDNPHAKLIA